MKMKNKAKMRRLVEQNNRNKYQYKRVVRRSNELHQDDFTRRRIHQVTEEDSVQIDDEKRQSHAQVRVTPMDYNSEERKQHFEVVQLDDTRPGFVSRAEKLSDGSAKDDLGLQDCSENQPRLASGYLHKWKPHKSVHVRNITNVEQYNER